MAATQVRSLEVFPTHEPPLVGSPGFSRLGDAQPANAGTTNYLPIRFMAATHIRILEVFPFHGDFSKSCGWRG
jgi:hypothetical protein